MTSSQVVDAPKRPSLEGKDQAMLKDTAIMLCGHGSRDKAAVDEFNNLADRLRGRLPGNLIESGFLEFATPVIRTGFEKLRDLGAKRIVALPGMLFAAGHVKNDLPSEVNGFARAHPGIEVIYGHELGIDPKMLTAARTRISEALAGAAGEVPLSETLLMVVGRGTNDPDANSNISKVARMLWEGIGFGWAEVSFSGVAFPLVDAGLDRAVKLGYRRIVVFPYFLFTGILVRRIYKWTDEAAARHAGVEFIKAGYLNDQDDVIETFIERAGQALDGGAANAMNCQLCKYREQVLGFEDEKGTPQAGHHHHVVGAGVEEGAEDRGVYLGRGHGHKHGHGHDHDHSHAHGHDHVHDHGHDHVHDHAHDHDHGTKSGGG
ncbi:MAG: sirohydrochlorin chelatase [Proteobacteria bacterium]|nr:sirohydrochlorin chelatase [Pseudomonadota bacterium]